MSTEEEKAMAEELEKERQAKEKLVLETISSYCVNETTSYKDLCTIGAALKDGDKLVATAISGAKTNFSFKVNLEKSPDTAVFAKICFPYALWNPDRSVHYDLKRTENEYAIMKKFTDMMGGPGKAPVATPYLCLDVHDGEDKGNNKYKLLVTQWAPGDEQWCNQFIDGHVDSRVIPKLAVALATLNSTPVEDPDYNDNVRPCFRTMYSLEKMIFGQMIASPPHDDCTAAFHELGQEKFDKMIDKMEEEYLKKVELSHSDTAVFNILVEKKPSVEELKSFGDDGSFYICDWEMSFVGPTGRDVGIFQAWPIAAALSHAVQGNKAAAFEILDCLQNFWCVWADAMVEKGNKNDEYLLGAFRNSMGWISLYLVLAYYMMGLDTDILPLEGVPENDAKKAKSSIGLIGLKMLEYGFGGLDPDLTLGELRGRYKDLITEHFEMLFKVAESRGGRPRRRSSVLRETGRRISDASFMEEGARRASAKYNI